MMTSSDGIIFYILGAVIVFLLVFLLLREVFCWYWKINQIVKNQVETNELLKELIKKDTKNQNSTISETK